MEEKHEYYCPMIRKECVGKSCVLYGDADESELCDLAEAFISIRDLRERLGDIDKAICNLR